MIYVSGDLVVLDDSCLCLFVLYCLVVMYNVMLCFVCCDYVYIFGYLVDLCVV